VSEPRDVGLVELVETRRDGTRVLWGVQNQFPYPILVTVKRPNGMVLIREPLSAGWPEWPRPKEGIGPPPRWELSPADGPIVGDWLTEWAQIKGRPIGS
jgi:hypothetical protein